MPAVNRRTFFGLLAGTAAAGLLSACSSNNAKCRADYIAEYQAKHGGQMPTESQIASACPTNRSRGNGGYYGSGYRGSRRGGGRSGGSGGGK